MWDWSCFSFNPNKHHPDKPYSQNLLPLHHHHETPTTTPLSFLTMILTSWLSRRRVRRYLCLLLCSPFLLPLFCATCPFLFAAEICCRLCRRQRLKSTEGFDGASGSQQTEGGFDGSLGSFLLQRYLQDQLLLVIDEASITREDDDGIGPFGT